MEIRKPPKDIIDLEDSVHFKYISKLETIYQQNASCYISIDLNAVGYRIHLYPLERRTTRGLSFSDYSRWIELGKKHGLVVSNAEIDKRKTLSFQQGKNNKFQVFATLCMYRWSDTTPRMAWTFLRLIEDGMNFWQALHYVQAIYVRNPNHSFTSISNNVYSGKSQRNLCISVVSQQFFECMTENDRQKWINDICEQQYNNMRIKYSKEYLKLSIGASAIIDNIAEKWGPINVKCVKDLLDERYSPLFNGGKLDFHSLDKIRKSL